MAEEMITIWANHAYGFMHRDHQKMKMEEQSRIVRVPPKEFSTVPAWVQGDPMFPMALKDEDIRIVKNSPQVQVPGESEIGDEEDVDVMDASGKITKRKRTA